MRPQSGFVQLWEEQFSQHGSHPLPITFKRRTNLFYNAHGEKAASSSTPLGAIKGRRAALPTDQPTPRVSTWNRAVVCDFFRRICVNFGFWQGRLLVYHKNCCYSWQDSTSVQIIKNPLASVNTNNNNWPPAVSLRLTYPSVFFWIAAEF